MSIVIVFRSVAALFVIEDNSYSTLYHGHPCPSFWLGPELSLGIARLSLRQEGRTRVEALAEGVVTVSCQF